jgi:hypothetical protein
MFADAAPISRQSLRLAGAVSLLALAACAPSSNEPQQVNVSNPSVTYKYRTDPELVQANERAAAYCSTYQSVHRTVTFGTDPDGTKRVVFDCVKPVAVAPATVVTSPPPAVATVPATAPLTYTYMADAELIEASRNAQNYCAGRGSNQVMSNITTNTNGSRTVTFQCR